ncbi:hypothetical protein V1515DRAFT_632936 [Lipomyces mesembrius]
MTDRILDSFLQNPRRRGSLDPFELSTPTSVKPYEEQGDTPTRWHHEHMSESQLLTNYIVLYITKYTLTDPSHSNGTTANKEFSLASLAALSAYLWPVIYQRSNRYGSPSVGVQNHSLWKSDFAELACDTWLRTVGPTVRPSSLVVYHIMNIMLHTNLAGLKNFAHSPPGSER